MKKTPANAQKSLTNEFHEEFVGQTLTRNRLREKRRFAIDPNNGMVHKLARYPMGLTATVILLARRRILPGISGPSAQDSRLSSHSTTEEEKS